MGENLRLVTRFPREFLICGCITVSVLGSLGSFSGRLHCFTSLSWVRPALTLLLVPLTSAVLGFGLTNGVNWVSALYLPDQTRPACLQLSVLCLGRRGTNRWLSSVLREDEGSRRSSCLQVVHIVWPCSVLVSPVPPSTCPGIFLASCYPASEGAEKPPHTEPRG